MFEGERSRSEEIIQLQHQSGEKALSCGE